MPLQFYLFLTVLSCARSKYATDLQGERLNCTNLTEIPEGNERIEVIHASHNSFARIKSDTFRQKRLTSLKVALLRNNNIRLIEKAAFDGLFKLIILDLTGNDLEAFESGSFAGVDSLKVLILARNRIGSVPGEPFRHLDNLIFLDLSHNRVRVAGDVLRPLKSIKYLDVSKNPLDASSESAKLKSTTLKALRISFNAMHEIAGDFFARLPNLQVLDLSGSNLKIWPSHILRPLINLRVLYVDTLLSNEEEFIPATVEKLVYSKTDITTTDFISQILENLDGFNATSNFDFLEYLDDPLVERDAPASDSTSFDLFRRALLFSLLVYLSSMYTVCLAQVIKNLAYKPYQLLQVNEN